MMSDSRKAGRRTSDRLREKEDAPLPNGFGHGSERLKSSQSTGAATKQTKVNGNDTGASTAKGRGKRKIGGSRRLIWHAEAISQREGVWMVANHDPRLRRGIGWIPVHTDPLQEAKVGANS